jgi:hypothetical protein
MKDQSTLPVRELYERETQVLYAPPAILLGPWTSRASHSLVRCRPFPASGAA